MMKTRFLQRKLLITLTLSALAFNLYSENFRVGKVHTISLDSTDSENAQKNGINSGVNSGVYVGINEGFAIYLPEDKTFLEGIEIKMDIPEEVASWMDCVACSVYDKINPLPSTSQIDYSGVRQYVNTLPGRLSWVLQIPLKPENSIKANKYTTKIDTVPEFLNNVVFIRLQPVMKGVPEETLNAKIAMQVKPILIDKGQIDLNITSSDNADFECSVFIDDKMTTYSKTNTKLLLESGVHTVSVLSDSYRNEVRTIRIDQAKTTTLNILLKSTEPTLIVNCPESANVTLDGNPLDKSKIGTEFVISEGEHKISFSIGDYEIIRTIQANQGKSYTANFSLDLEITEE